MKHNHNFNIAIARLKLLQVHDDDEKIILCLFTELEL